METDPQSETKIQLPITLTIADFESLLAHFASTLGLALSKYTSSGNKRMDIKQLESVATVAYNIVSISEDLIKQLKNQD